MTAFSRLSAREKWLLGGCGALLFLLILWTYVWLPLAEQRAFQQDRIVRYLALIDLARQTTAPVPGPASSCTDASALGPRITRSAEASGIVLARLDPEGARLRVTVSIAEYIGVMSWIAELEAQSCIRAVSVDMARLIEPGQVSLRMTLEDAG